MKRALISIDGIDGCGKSFLASQLARAAEHMSIGLVTIRVDDFRGPVRWTDTEDEELVYYRDYYDFDRIDACLRGFLAGDAEWRVPVFDSVAQRVCGERTVSFDGAAMLVLEGVFPMRAAATRDGVRIYVATSYEAARNRVIERDMPKGRSRDEVERRIDQRYVPAQRRYHQNHCPRSCAHVVIDHEELGRPRLLRASLASQSDAVKRVLLPTLRAMANPRRVPDSPETS